MLLRALLEREGLDVVGEAGTGLEALTLARSLAPDLVVVDISMPGLNGIETTRRLLAELPGVKVIMLSMHSEPRYVAATFEAGAVGYVRKDAAGRELLQAVRAVAEGRTYASPAPSGP